MPGKGITRYELVDGPEATVLRATTNGKAATGLYWRSAWPEKPLPHAIRWSWLASRFFEAADVSDTWMDDSPGRVVLAFDGDLERLGFRDRLFREQVKLFTGVDLPYATLIYVWDPKLPVGSVVPVPQTSRIRYIVVESGARGVGSWRSYRRHVVSDFRQAFAEPPGRLLATGLMTDSDDLGGNFDTLYGDLRFDWAPPAST